MLKINKKRKGFTLLEILLVIGAIGILAAIVLVAINPNRQIAQARNAQRRSDINTIYKALEQYLIDNKVYPTSINETKQDICIGTNTPANCISLNELVPTYLSSIPKDPSGGVYKVYKNSENNRIGVEAAGAELGQSLVLNPIAIPLVTATGGNITTINENGIWYKVHTFTTNGTFTVTGGSLNVEYLVVGGGGGGGAGNGGGGGSGGFLTGTGFTVSPSSYSITVGSGGNGGVHGSGGSYATAGGNSVFSTIISTGGGYGGGGKTDGDNLYINGGTGGSGGGGAARWGSGTGGVRTIGQGNNGAAAEDYGAYPCGGGGGASAAGGAGTGSGVMKGGDGAASSITGSPVIYAGGGGGAVYSNWYGPGVGGLGGGGDAKTNMTGESGDANTGGGGGGGGGSSRHNGGNGGSGIVIVRYIIPAP